jgi:long-chain acyl-CoA synthetase
MLEVLRDFILHRFPEIRTLQKGSDPWYLRLWRFRVVHRLLGWRFCCFVVGGAPLPLELEKFWSNLGFIVVQGYGLTETAPIISFNHPFHLQKGTAGRPLSSVQVRIAPDGEVLVRGASVTPGYFQVPSETTAAFENGWFHTGDIGELTTQGALVIRGRKKEVIVTPEGLKIFPEDVEDILDHLQGVSDSSVIDRNGVHAVLVLKPGFKPEDILRQANQRLEPYQRIRSVSLWTQGELPRTDVTGKLRRGEIARVLQTGRQEPGEPHVKLADLVQKYAPGRSITADTTLEELGLSSLDRVELMMDLEERLQTSIDENLFASVSTVADLARPMEPALTTPEPTYNRTWIARLLRGILLPTVIFPLTKIFAHHLKISGSGNLSRIQGPVIFAANHQSYLDAPMVLASLPRSWRYRVAPAMWKEYFDAHFFPERHTFGERLINSLAYGLVTLLLNAFPLPQVEAGTRQSLRYIGELVEEGWSVLIFPEGERTMTGEIGRFYPGVAMVAKQMRIPVIPIRLKGLDKVWHRNTIWPRPGPVEVHIGVPVSLKGDSYTALVKQVEDAVREL